MRRNDSEGEQAMPKLLKGRRLRIECAVEQHPRERASLQGFASDSHVARNVSSTQRNALFMWRIGPQLIALGMAAICVGPAVTTQAVDPPAGKAPQAQAPAAAPEVPKPNAPPAANGPQAPNAVPPKPVVQVQAPAGAAVQIQVQAQGGQGQKVIIQGGVQIQGAVQMRGGVARRMAPNGAMSADGTEAPELTVFRDPPREIVQRTKQSETMIAEGRFAEAVELLGGILEQSEDYYYREDLDSPTRVSLKNDAQRRIGELPPRGREEYELQYGTKAAQMLDAALEEGNDAKLAEVARCYFHTRAGYQAAYLMALEHLDQGRPLAAALSLRRILENASVAAQWEPELSLRLATAWARAGAFDTAQKVIDEAKRNHPSAEFMIAGEMKRWFAGDVTALAWLNQNTVGKAETKTGRPVEWAVFRGDAARNAVGVGGSPLLNRRWAVPFVNHPEIEKLVARLRQSYEDREQVLLPSAHPLAVDDVVLVRTFAGLTAVDFRTGKRIWRGAEDEAIRQVLDRDVPLTGRGGGDSTQVSNWIDELSWHNATLGTFSSDGKRAYCVEQSPSATPDVLGRRSVILANGRQFISGPPSLNRLAAYDLSTQGKLAWEISGGDASLSESYFLGPPLPLGDRLYVLGESKGEIRLIALLADSGKVDWTQQLAIIDENTTDMQLRRSSGLSPSYADGVLVCPTSLGAVVGVDLNDRSLLWGFQFERENQTANRHNVIMWQVGRGDTKSDVDHWQDATVTLAEGKVLIASPESQQLFCLNLLDGKLAWKQPRARGLYVACVAGGNVVVAAADEMRAYTLADGKTAWTASLPEGAKPSGRGFYNGKSYYVPLTTAEVAALDVAVGRFTARSRSRAGNVPGNLVCYRGAVVSQSPTGVECFFQIEDLKREVAARLKEKPNDPEALASSGELLLDEGKIDEAIKLLRQSYASAAESRTRNLLVDALLEGLSGGIATTDADLAELEQLVDGTEKQESYLRLRGEALAKAGKRRGAFESYLRLADLASSAEQPIRATADVSVRRERWVKARIDELLAGADEADRKAMREEADRRREATIASRDLEKMRQFLRYFDDGAEADPVRMELAARLIEAGELLEAENLLLAVAGRGDSAASTEAVGRLTKLLVDAGRLLRTTAGAARNDARHRRSGGSRDSRGDSRVGRSGGGRQARRLAEGRGRRRGGANATEPEFPQRAVGVPWRARSVLRRREHRDGSAATGDRLSRSDRRRTVASFAGVDRPSERQPFQPVGHPCPGGRASAHRLAGERSAGGRRAGGGRQEWRPRSLAA
jgi:outer membrane protein assembly factor BamB/tetratricopeptide (TPR) repeat protein